MPTHRLPSQPTLFIGRENELAEITNLLQTPDCRLLTLVGPGGIGKTRLAIELARQFASSDNIYFVALLPLTAPDYMIPAIAEALDISLSGKEEPKKQLLHFLSERRLLLLLDNFEHLLDGANLLVEILECAPEVKLLVTSREPLHLREEWVFNIGGLLCPDRPTVESVDTFPASALFVQCARRLGYIPSGEDTPSIIHICRLVEGIPLALELAASWVRALSVSSIAEQIEASIDFLSISRLYFPPRHQSMRAVFDHSWQLLSQEEQAVFRSLAVFRGGFTTEAARLVANAALQTLAALIDKSLVRLGSDARYDLHELLRQYAAEKLDEVPEFRETVIDRHCEYYTEFLHQQEATIHLRNQAEALKELDNLRTAWKYAARQCRQEALLRAAHGLYWLYHFQHLDNEGAAMFQLAEDAVHGISATDNGRFLLGMFRLFRCIFQQQQPEQAETTIATALALWDGLNERPEMGLPLTRAMLTALGNTGNPEQIKVLADKALDFSRRHDDLAGVAISLTALADVTYVAFGDFAEAQRLLEAALAIDQRIGFHLNARWAEGLMGNIASLEGRYSDSKRHFEASIAHHHAGNITRSLDVHLLSLGMTALELGDNAEALKHIEASIEVATELVEPVRIALGQAAKGIYAAFLGDVNAAAYHYEDVRSYFQAIAEDSFRYYPDLENCGLLALLTEQYQTALRYYNEVISHHERTGYRVPRMFAHCRSGHALVGLADEMQAKPHLLDAFREAQAIGAYQLQLEALVGIAQLSFIPSNQAVELFVLARDHPAANRFSRRQAERGLITLKASLLPDDFTVATEHGRILSLRAAGELVEAAAFEFEITANQPLVEPLSTRELEILRLVATGLSNREIAEQLHIGISTVKKHINHIFDKLDATHRAQAVARARSYKILA